MSTKSNVKGYPEKLLVLHFGELWLKGGNRDSYVNRLKKNINGQLNGENFTLERQYDRLIIRLNKDSDEQGIKEKLSKTFGISGYEVAYVTDPNLKSITELSRKLLKGLDDKSKSVKIRAHRSYKKFNFDSRDIVENVLKIVEKTGKEPVLHDYDSELFINVTKENAFLSIERAKGPYGLPVGTSGKGIVLMSGGIDSPVAAWHAMKRGIEPVYVHIHGFQESKEVMNTKIPRILKILSTYYPHYRSYLVPIHVFQVAAIRSRKYELILMKAFMLRIAERIAKLEGAGVIFTGESLGQVASQTTSNLMAEQNGIKLPVLRPLIGFDKNEIINLAKKIGTYEESIKEYRDVCSINAKNPATQTSTDEIIRLSKEVRLQYIVGRSLKLTDIISA